MDVLIVEDEDAIAEPLAQGLEREGFQVRRVATGAAALEEPLPDLVLLDLRLPDIDGYDVCRELRQRSDVPIIVVTARGEEADRVIGLELGADDYVVKPFGLRELVARIRAVTRRSRAERKGGGLLRVGRLEVDPRARIVRLDGCELALTAKEFDLLELFVRDAGAVVSRERMLQEVWQTTWYGSVEDDRRARGRAAAEARRSRLDRDRARRRLPPPRSMNRRLLLSYASLVLFVLVVLEVPLAVYYSRNERTVLADKVERDAVAVGSFAEGALERPHELSRVELQRLVRSYGAQTRGRVVVVDARGVARADSGGVPGAIFSSRPEIVRALHGRVAQGIRHSRTLGGNLLYVAVPVASAGKVFGAVRITYPTSAVDARVHRYWLILAAIGAIVFAVALLLGLTLARSISRPLRDVEDAAIAAGEGDLSARAPTDEGPPEVRALARAINETVAKLEQVLDSQQAFVADASHQLRTPLTALRLRLENLEREVPADVLEGALKEVDRLSRLVSGLLALARADVAVPSGPPMPIEAVVRDRVHAWQDLASERGIVLRAQVEPDVPSAARATGSTRCSTT